MGTRLEVFYAYFVCTRSAGVEVTRPKNKEYSCSPKQVCRHFHDHKYTYYANNMHDGEMSTFHYQDFKQLFQSCIVLQARI